MPKVSDDGWTVVGPSKSALFKKKKIEEAAEMKAKKALEDEAKKGFNVLQQKEKAKKEVLEEESPKAKVPKTEEEKAKERKERKKEAAKKNKIADPKTSSPKSASYVNNKMQKLPKRITNDIKDLPKKYPGRVKDQFLTAVAYLDDYLTPECQCAPDYKSLPAQQRWELPLSHAPDAMELFTPIIQGSTDSNMWCATLKDLLLAGFGRQCNRPDDGKNYLGSKIAMQVLLKTHPDSFNNTVENIFALEGGEMAPAAAMNFAWVLSNLADSSAMDGVQSWARVFYPRLVANEGKSGGAVVETGFAVAESLGLKSPSEPEKKRWWLANKEKDPLTFEQLATPLRLIAPKRNKMLKLYTTMLPKFSALFTTQSPRTYFTKIAAMLGKANEVNKPLMLQLLVDCMVLDPNMNGPLHCWTNSILMMVKESSMILEYISKNQKSLSTRLNGIEMEKFFERLTAKCKAIQDGSLVPEGKKSKHCNYTPSEVAAILYLLGKVSSLAKAVPLEAPKTKKTEQAIKQVRDKAAGRYPICEMLFLIVALFTAVVLAINIALPFLPKEMAAAIETHTTGLKSSVAASVSKAYTQYQYYQPYVSDMASKAWNEIASKFDN
eukprot:TRINITY_DN2299_c0_g2_i1.p1 TRINITY_DN2299_c0_g2~~TRINITY_DN2299_c0_g2_i1.p1  ORF type:complete len:607 (+),score=150.78 TRINITY_DN2299_c0_g2_i1:55-1875(+)